MDKCIICGCIKDGEQYIEKVFENIKKIQALFKKTKIIIAYDKSSDKTLEILNSLQKDFDIDILINEVPLSSVRTINIQNARNAILDKINKLYSDYEYFIMMDLDDVCSNPINITILEDGIKDQNDWDALFFNNENYYDFWALSFDDFEYSCWHTTNSERLINIMNLELKKKFNNTDKYIECNSAFGGLGIYKVSKFVNSRYKTICDVNNKHLFDINKMQNIFNRYKILYRNNQGIYDCEHRYFHLTTIYNNNARLKISKQYLFPKYQGVHTDIIWH